MKTVLLFLLLLPIFAIGQKQLNLTRQSDGKIVTVVDNRRVRIVTKNGDVHKGRIHFIDASKVLIRKDTIALADIDKLKTKSWLASVGGFYIINSGIIMGAVASPFIGVPIVAGGLWLPLGRSNHKSSEWRYEITEN